MNKEEKLKKVEELNQKKEEHKEKLSFIEEMIKLMETAKNNQIHNRLLLIVYNILMAFLVISSSLVAVNIGMPIYLIGSIGLYSVGMGIMLKTITKEQTLLKKKFLKKWNISESEIELFFDAKNKKTQKQILVDLESKLIENKIELQKINVEIDRIKRTETTENQDIKEEQRKTDSAYETLNQEEIKLNKIDRPKRRVLRPNQNKQKEENNE